MPNLTVMSPQPDVSVVVPLFEEEDNVRPLVRGIREALADVGRWEVVLVDDGSADGTFEAARAEARHDERVHVLCLARNYGQTTAMQAGFDYARGRVLVSMDGDLQNDPRDIPRLVAKLEEGYDLAAGYRQSRRDRLLTRRVPSWVANRLIQALTAVPIRDNGCTLKAFRRDVLNGLRLYSDMHRFIPAIVAGTVSDRIAEIPVRHHPRRFGRSKYGLSRMWKVLADLLAVTMIRWFRERPLVMFGWAATGAAAAGAAFTLAALIAAARFAAPKASALVFPGSAFLWFGLAGYLLMLGLICEVVLRESPDREPFAADRKGRE